MQVTNINYDMKLLNKLFFIIYILGNICPVFGQQISTEPMNSCWYKLGNVSLSEDGKWVSYMKIYNDSTLWALRPVNDLNSEKLFKNVFVSGFVGKSGFVIQSGSKVEVHNLKTDKATLFENARIITSTYNWQKGTFIYQKSKVLTHYSSELKKAQWEEVEQFQYNTDEDRLVIRTLDSWRFYTKSINGWQLEKNIISKEPWLKLNFTDTGYWFVFQHNDDYFLKVLDHQSEKEYLIKTTEEAYSMVENTKDLDWDGERLWFKLDDGSEKTLFGASDKTSVSGVPEIWRGTDKLLYPVKKYMRGAVLGSYTPSEDQLNIYRDTVYSNYVLANKGKTVLMYNSLTHQKYIRHDDMLRASLWDASSGKLLLQMDSLSPYKKNMVLTQSMDKMVLFKKNSWWVYEINNKKWISLAKYMPLYQLKNVSETEKTAPYYPILSHDEKYLYLHDANDVWRVNLDTYESTRLTKGKEENIIYRIAEASYTHSRIIKSWEWSYQYRLVKNKELLFSMEAEDKSRQGLAYLKNGQVRTLVFADAKISSPKTAGNTISFVKETFNTKPELWLFDINKAKLIKILESNRECGEVGWGEAEMISYEVDGKTYSAALFYPKDYNADKKYPMVVNFYEAEAEWKHEFVPPNYQYGDGFNRTDYSANGYFVLTPDIHYQIGNPGGSAVKHLEQSVYAALKKASIDKEAVGLLGHSFGGYQVNYTVGHSNLFKAAVSSAGISNLVSWYFHISANTFRPEFWRMEGNQLRMGKSYFDMKEAYEDQSPVRSADKVNTPLLLVAGKEDQHVVYTQTIEMYLALYRLKKPVTMLLYPGEAHGLLKNENNIDLRNKVMQWFDYYLKKKRKPDWISADK